MRDYLPEITSTIVLILLVTALIFGIAFGADACSAKHDEKLWNNGSCDVCGGTWKYEQAVGHGYYSTSYIYICDDCGKRIEIYDAK